MVEAGGDRLPALAAGARHHRLGRQRDRDIDVGNAPAHQRIAHRAADEARLLAVAPERRQRAAHTRPVEQAGERRGLSA